MICREKMKINYIKMKCTNIHSYAATIARAKPGNPASRLYNTLGTSILPGPTTLI